MINIRHFLLILAAILPAWKSSAAVSEFPNRVDSLSSIVNAAGVSDSLKIESYLSLAWELKSSQPRLASDYARQGIDLAEKNGLDHRTAYGLSIMGVIYWQAGDFPNALLYQMDSHSLYLELNDDTGIGRTLSNLGLIFSDQGHYEKAHDYFFQAMRILEKQDNKVAMAPVLNNIGLVYQYKGEFQLAEAFHLRSLEIKKEINDQKGIAFSMNNLAWISQNSGNYELALEYFRRSLAIREELKDQRELAITYSDLGFLFYLMDSLSMAENHLQHAIKICATVDDQSGLARCYNYLGKVKLKQGNFSRANQYFENSLEISRRLGIIPMVMNNYRDLSQLNAKRNNFKQAFELQERFLTMRDSILSLDSQRRMTEIHMVYDRERQHQENELLRKSYQINTLSMEKQLFQRNTLLAGIILVLILLFFLYNRYLTITNANKKLEMQKDKISESNQKLLLLNRDLMKEKQKVDELNLKLKEANQKLQESQAHLINTNKTKDKFFSIISHDLRNPFASIVSFSRILKREINDLSKEDLQDLAMELDKSVLKINNLLENLLQWSRSQTGNVSFNPEYIAFNEIVEENLNLFSGNAQEKDIEIYDEIDRDLVVYADLNMTNTVVRNLLSNALKYTRAGGRIILSSRIKNARAYFSVADNGVGISAENIKKLFRVDTLHTTFGTSDEKGSGLGLLLVKEFVEKQGGEISLESIEGQGTTVTFYLPVED